MYSWRFRGTALRNYGTYNGEVPLDVTVRGKTWSGAMGALNRKLSGLQMKPYAIRWNRLPKKQGELP